MHFYKVYMYIKQDKIVNMKYKITLLTTVLNDCFDNSSEISTNFK